MNSTIKGRIAMSVFHPLKTQRQKVGINENAIPLAVGHVLFVLQNAQRERLLMTKYNKLVISRIFEIYVYRFG